ncbi:transcriptional regulator, TetR family [Terribacillus aidingensis]|uniref:Transcriptional regulator, TetR family n=1 Tax=Terribacillus aidingensis TaxID=586416 RepID=A0A285N032_9BACI|nr:TetR/AcrR family transcriptional regulator [Terribacillus aidingensis]SNZ02814.1 transcriptional regulator, TetR family [Terribacillus aidingensis]
MNTKEKILNATAELILEEGVSNCTLAKIAKKAAISKGGLLYHYHTKEALFQELNFAAIREFEEAMARHLAEQPNGKGAFTKAYALATLEDIKREGTPRSTALISIFSDHPEIMTVWQDGYTRWRQQFEQDGLEWEDAATIRFVCDGLWFNEVAGTMRVADFAADLLHKLLARIDKEEE